MTKDNQKFPLWPADLFVIDDIETLRVVADPLRLRILELLRREPATVKHMAKELGVPLKKLYYHVNLLESHQLIRVVSTRVVSGIIEKQYQVTAYRLAVNRTLLSPGPDEEANGEGLDTFLSFILDHSKSEIKKSIAAGLIDLSQKQLSEGGFILGRLWMSLTPQQAEEYNNRLMEVTKEFFKQHKDQTDPNAHYYEILVGIYPTLAPPEGEEQNDE